MLFTDTKHSHESVAEHVDAGRAGHGRHGRHGRDGRHGRHGAPGRRHARAERLHAVHDVSERGDAAAELFHAALLPVAALVFLRGAHGRLQPRLPRQLAFHGSQ